ncbi:MAG: uroporphyrinogen decarboxylase family protein, partial [Eubacteriales bacterium]|jgi:uroporphyrinogen decarboxylase
MPINLESYSLISRHFDKPLAISLQGPFTLASELMGVMDLVRAIIRNPQYVTDLLNYTTEVVLTYALAAVQAGVKFLCISEPTAVLLSPPRFNQLVSDNLRKIFASIDAWKILHVCGDTTFLMPQLINCGAEGLSLDQVVDLPGVAPRIPDEVVIIGNIDPLNVLAELTPAEIREKTLELLFNMKDYPNFIVSFGCDCLPDTPVKNLKAAMEGGRTLIK